MAIADCKEVDKAEAERVDATDIKEDQPTLLCEGDPTVTGVGHAERLAGSSSTKGKLETILCKGTEFFGEDLLPADLFLEDLVRQLHQEEIVSAECCKDGICGWSLEFGGGGCWGSSCS